MPPNSLKPSATAGAIQDLVTENNYPQHNEPYTVAICIASNQSKHNSGCSTKSSLMHDWVTGHLMVICLSELQRIADLGLLPHHTQLTPRTADDSGMGSN
ncbi:hypothetical protein CEXT_273461 [Caerostris extrusa]|uniref:Uncharacterized protein n=1 Tax=Caerostris extrusa TaxID=172846 RepID=A0AAV4PXK3_CAEEX|nr:hypothetical protein CEXT_273461 [Caerostris extrusa]